MGSYDRHSGPVPPCYICHEQHRTWHQHHVTMRAKTGERGPLVILCGSCHSGIHAVALARVAKLKGGKPNPQNLEWSYSRHPQELTKAEALIKPLVQVLLMSDGADLPKVASLEIPVAINNGLMRLKQDLGVTNRNAAILYCCATVLAARGLLNSGMTNARSIPTHARLGARTTQKRKG